MEPGNEVRPLIVFANAWTTVKDLTIRLGREAVTTIWPVMQEGSYWDEDWEAMRLQIKTWSWV